MKSLVNALQTAVSEILHDEFQKMPSQKQIESNNFCSFLHSEKNNARTVRIGVPFEAQKEQNVLHMRKGTIVKKFNKFTAKNTRIIKNFIFWKIYIENVFLFVGVSVVPKRGEPPSSQNAFSKPKTF